MPKSASPLSCSTSSVTLSGWKTCASGLGVLPSSRLRERIELTRVRGRGRFVDPDAGDAVCSGFFGETGGE